jgi:hypothetical protein
MDVHDGSRVKGFPPMGEIASIWLELALTDLRLKFLPYRLNRRFIFDDPASSAELRTERENLDLAEVERLKTLVAKAAGLPIFFTMTCLRRSLVLRSRLAKAGIPSRLVLGATKRGSGSICRPSSEGGSFGHAWLKVGDIDVDTYTSSRSASVFLPNASGTGNSSDTAR